MATTPRTPAERQGPPVRRGDEPPSLPEDRVLLERARAQDREAFGALVGRYEKALEGILAAYTRDRHLARDLVQDAVLRAFKNLHRYREEYRFSTWFFRIGINLAITARRRAAYDQRARDPDHRDGPAGRLVAPETPVEALLRREDIGLLRAALGRLPPRYQEVLRMRYVEGIECKEIARRMSATPNTVSIILFRAKQRLKDDLDPA